ncbi:24917_t:CDS:2, partial [Dentiscutata erythropus]
MSLPNPPAWKFKCRYVRDAENIFGVDGENVKSSDLKFVENDFKKGIYDENLHVFIKTTNIHVDNKYTIKVEFLNPGWNLRPNKNYIDGAILVYDVSQTDGLEKIIDISHEYVHNDSYYVANEIPIMIVANNWDKNKKSRDDLLKEVKNFVGEEFLCTITSKEEKISPGLEEILK